MTEASTPIEIPGVAIAANVPPAIEARVRAWFDRLLEEYANEQPGYAWPLALVVAPIVNWRPTNDLWVVNVVWEDVMDPYIFDSSLNEMNAVHA